MPSTMKHPSIFFQPNKLKINVLANFTGFSWLALIQIALIPLYIKFMGIEAYGLIGFYITIQAIFQAFDLGFTPTTNRELARLSTLSEGDAEIRSFTRTVEYVYWPLGLLMGICILVAAPFISTHWIRAEALSEGTLREALFLMSVLILIQWPLTLYLGGLMGLQRQVMANGLQIGLSVLTDGGAILVLWLVSPTITAYLKWQIIAGLIRFFCLRKALWSCLPAGDELPRFNPRLLKRVGHFAAGMSGIALTAIVLTQFDRVVLSKLLSLEQFGYYMVAGTVANGLLIIVSPVFNAVFPRFSSLVASGKTDNLITLYRLSAQSMAVLVLPLGLLLCTFSRELLALWTGSGELARSTGAILCLLLVGRMLNGLMHIPYALQLAYGWSGLGLRINIFLITVFVPGVLFLANQYGALGAASMWAGVNLLYILVGVPLTHRRLLRGEASRWFAEGLFLPLMIAGVVIGTGRALWPSHESSPAVMLYAVFILFIAISFSGLSARETRKWAAEEIAKIRRSFGASKAEP
jgi:O-antigen/teichoic acid export membrane protein